MSATVIKRGMKNIFRRFGYELERTAIDPFVVQRKLIMESKPIIFDIGAHIGETARIYRKYFPFARIHCFEPSPQSARELQFNLKDDKRSYCHAVAVSETQGISRLNINQSAATNSLLASKTGAASYWGEGLLDTVSHVEVATTTVDSFCLDHGITHLDILKMDVQGGEFSILSGAKEILSRQNISLIYTEIILCPTYEDQHKLHEYLAFLDSFGYAFLDFYHPVWHKYQLIQCDMIFLHPSFLNNHAE